MKKIIYILFILLAGIMMNSCKKNRLDNNFPILTGEWEFDRACNYSPGGCYGLSVQQHTLVFKKDRYYKVKRQDDKRERGKISEVEAKSDSSATIIFKNNVYFHDDVFNDGENYVDVYVSSGIVWARFNNSNRNINQFYKKK